MARRFRPGIRKEETAEETAEETENKIHLIPRGPEGISKEVVINLLGTPLEALQGCGPLIKTSGIKTSILSRKPLNFTMEVREVKK